MNIVQSVMKAVTQPRTPLHAGEVFALWSLYIGVVEARVLCQLLANHTSDANLKETIEHLVDELEEPLIKKLNLFLLHEGVQPPGASGDKPLANEADIPPGAKLTDMEVANLLVVKLEGMLNLAHFGLAQSLRDDVGVMLLNAYQHLVAQGFTLKKLMREHGWLRVPPMFPLTPERPAH